MIFTSCQAMTCIMWPFVYTGDWTLRAPPALLPYKAFPAVSIPSHLRRSTTSPYWAQNARAREGKTKLSFSSRFNIAGGMLPTLRTAFSSL